jgi:hypothetical protein
VTLAQRVGRIWVAGAICPVLCACYPALTAVQPRVDLRVTDTRGAPIEDAAFTLVTFKQPFRSAETALRATYRTDESGSLTLPKRRRWVWQVVLPDGMTWYTWAYCVEKPGYKATAESDESFGEPIAIVLEDATAPSACVWPSDNEAYWHVRTSDDE